MILPPTILEILRGSRFVPVIRTRLARHAATAVQWLRDVGVRNFEITLTIPEAIPLIRELARDSALLVGAGTVTDEAAAKACLAAGARFIVAPWIDPNLAKPCQEADALLILGALTPSEVRMAVSAGAGAVKIFPVASAGGPGLIKALRSVLPEVPLCPTGGVEPNSLGHYLSAGADFVGIGGALVNSRLIEGGDREAIQAAAVQLITTASAEK